MLFRIGLNKVSLLVIGLSVTACSKDDNASLALEDGKSTVIYDLAGDTKASIADGIDGKEKRPFFTFLYNLEEKRQIWIRTREDSLRWFKTDEWDLAFTDNYNGDIKINNKKYIGTPGYEGPVEKSAILMLEQSYNNVSTAPSDSQFDQSTTHTVGWATDGNSPGWYSYDLALHIMKAFPNRTYALRLPDGKYAKLQIVNAYKGNPPAISDLYWPAPYFTFRYFIQQDGSKNLKTN